MSGSKATGRASETSSSHVTATSQTGSESGAGSMRSEGLDTNETSRSSDLTTRASVPTVSAQAAEVTSEVTAVANTAVAVSIEADKKRQEQEAKLNSLSTEIGTYLGRLGNREGAESALLKGKTTIEAIQNALTDPNADLNALISEATRTRNTVVNTVLRASSGA